MAKSLMLTYILWLVGGFCGLHHFYLGRDWQAFLWWCTLGGYAGCGWLRDLFHIREYVADANEEKSYIMQLSEKIRRNRKPPRSTTRFVGTIIVAYLWGSVLMLAIPEDKILGISWTWLNILVPYACALGVYTVGNIGREQGTIWWALGTAYAVFPFYFYLDETNWLTLTTFVATMAFDTMSKEWRRTPVPKKTVCQRCSILLFCAMLYLSLWCSFLYFNAKLVDSEGEEVPIREAISHFFSSPWWVDLKQSLVDVWTFAQHHGWAEIWRQIVELSDPHGEINALKVLDLPENASQEEITSKWRKMSREWHPDKVKDPEKKITAQEKFMEIQQAYEILSSIKARRSKRNRKYKEE